MTRMPSLTSRAAPRVLAVLAALTALGGSPALAQFRFQFQPPRVVVTPQVRAPQVRTYTFGARNHVDDLAVLLMRQANSICLEMHRNYRHNPGYRETYREMYQVLQDAKHIHELVHDHYHHRDHRGERDHIASDLHEMDGLVHHVEEDIANWTPAHAHHDHFHHGAVHGQGQNLQRLMHSFSETLHHLMTDYGVRSQIGQSGEAPPPDGDIIAPPPEDNFPIRPRRP